MPQYITAADLLATGPRRLAQAATPDDATVLDADTLRRAIGGEDLSIYGYDPSTVAAAAEAVTHIGTAIDRAEGDLDNACRDRYALPLDAIDDGTRGMLLDLALAYTFRYARPVEVETGRQSAERRLERIAAGAITLSATGLAATGAASAGSPEYSATDAVLDPDSMGPTGGGWPTEGW